MVGGVQIGPPNIPRKPMSDDTTPVKFSAMHAFERHFQTLLLSVLTGLLAWTYTTTQNTQVTLAAVRAQTEGLREDLNKMQLAMERAGQDAYTASRAQIDLAMVNKRIDQLEQRTLDLERKR